MNVSIASKIFNKLVNNFPSAVAIGCGLSSGEIGSSCLLFCLGALGLLTQELIDDIQEGNDIDTIRKHVEDAFETLKQQHEGIELVADFIAIEKDINVDQLGFDDSKSPYLIIHRFIQGEFDDLTEEVQSIVKSQDDLNKELNEIQKQQLQFLTLCREIAKTNPRIEQIEKLTKKNLKLQKHLLTRVLKQFNDLDAFIELTLEEFSLLKEQFNSILIELSKPTEALIPLEFEIDSNLSDDRHDESQKSFRFHFQSRRTEMLGRDDEWSELLQFLKPDPSNPFDLKWWVWTGPGGLGKSRLALELCLEAQSKGYHAGFLQEIYHEQISKVVIQQPHLIIIDYTVLSPNLASDLISNLNTIKSSVRAPIRILILERSADSKIDHWFRSFVAPPNNTKSRIIAKYNYGKKRELSALSNSALWKIMNSIFKEFKKDYSSYQKSEILENLNKIDPLRRPLFAMMAADSLAQAPSNDFQSLRQWDQSILSDRILNKELGRWEESNINDQLLNNIFFCTITGAKSFQIFDEINQLISDEEQLLISGEELNYKKLQQIFSFSQRTKAKEVIPYEPDILGEYFVLQRLLAELRIDGEQTSKRKKEAFQLLKLAWCRFPKKTASFLLRTAQDFPDHPAKKVIKKLSEDQCEIEQYSLAHPLVLRGTAFLFFEEYSASIADFTQVIEELPSVPVPLVARALVNRGISHERQGELEQAINDYTQIIDKLAGSPVDQVARALVNRGNLHKELGALEQTIADFSRVIKKLPGAPIDQIARALVNRGMLHEKQGAQEQANADYSRVIDDLLSAPINLIAHACFHRGNLHKEQGALEQAIDDYTQIIDKLPGAPVDLIGSALHSRGTLHKEQGAQEQANADFSRLQKDFPGYYGTLFGAIFGTFAGLLKLQQETKRNSIDDYTKVIEEHPDAPVDQVAQALVNRGLLHAEQGAPEQANADFTRVIEELPGAPVDQVAWALINRGISYYGQGAPELEIADYTKVIVELPDAPVDMLARALVNRGIIHNEQGALEQAISDFTQVIEVLPDAPVNLIAQALGNRGMLHGKQGALQREIADYTQIIEALPNAPVDQVAQALVNRGLLHTDQGAPEQAIDDYTQIIEALPDAHVDQVAQALVNRGLLHADQGAPEREIADYTRIIEEFPDVSVNLVSLALVYRGIRCSQQGALEQAIDDYTQVIEVLPDAPVDQVAQALVNRGLLHAEQGAPEQAIADYTQIIEELPSAPVDQVALALVYRGIRCSQQGALEQAIDDYTQVIEVLPDAPVDQVAQALVYRGLLHADQGAPEQAIADYTQIIEELPGAPVYLVAWALANRGYKRSEQGLTKKAFADYTQIIEEIPDAPVDIVVHALVNRSHISLKQKDPNSVIHDSTIVLETLKDVSAENLAISLMNRGEAYNLQQKYKLALIDIRKAISINVLDQDTQQYAQQLLAKTESEISK